MVLQQYQTISRRYLAAMIDSLVFLPFPLVGIHTGLFENSTLYVCWTALHLICWTLYVVIGHGILGQTLGKRLMGIKVLDISEKKLIGIKKAFVRESVPFFVSVGFLITMIGNPQSELNPHFEVGGLVGLISVWWFILEMITMLFSNKRRALHDLMAASVVVDLNALKRVELQNRQQELIASLHKG